MRLVLGYRRARQGGENYRSQDPGHAVFNSSSPLRYSPSGNSSATGWSAAAPKRSMIFASAPASNAAPATIDWNSSAETPPEQEKVASSPPGASSFKASRLTSLYARAAPSACAAVGASFGGSSTIRS